VKNINNFAKIKTISNLQQHLQAKYLDKAIKQELQDVARQKLLQFATDAEMDTQILLQSGLSENMRNAITIRRDEKAVLQEFLKNVNKINLT
jgi:hypothetical protein